MLTWSYMMKHWTNNIRFAFLDKAGVMRMLGFAVIQVRGDDGSLHTGMVGGTKGTNP